MLKKFLTKTHKKPSETSSHKSSRENLLRNFWKRISISLPHCNITPSYMQNECRSFALEIFSWVVMELKSLQNTLLNKSLQRSMLLSTT